MALAEDRMFSSAVQLICEKGAANTTLKEICELAGYSRALASMRYGSKGAFLDALVRYLDNRRAEFVRQSVGDTKGLKSLRLTMDAVTELLILEPLYTKCLHILRFESLSGFDPLGVTLAALLRERRRNTARILREAIDLGEISADIDCEILSFQVASSSLGSIYQWLIEPGGIDIKAAMDNYRDLTFQLLKSFPAKPSA